MNGEVIVVEDVPGEFSERVIEAFHTRPGEGFSMALSGGETARRCYERLAVDPMRCDEGADAYHLLVGDLGRFDVVHLGLGTDGHTASLFPGSAALEADPGRLVVLNEDPKGNNPHQRMTLTYSG